MRDQPRAARRGRSRRSCDHLVDINNLQLEVKPSALDARDIEQVVDQSRLQLDIAPDHLELVRSLGVGLELQPSRHRGRDRRQGGTKLVPQHRQDPVLGAAGGLRFVVEPGVVDRQRGAAGQLLGSARSCAVYGAGARSRSGRGHRGASRGRPAVQTWTRRRPDARPRARDAGESPATSLSISGMPVLSTRRIGCRLSDPGRKRRHNSSTSSESADSAEAVAARLAEPSAAPRSIRHRSASWGTTRLRQAAQGGFIVERRREHGPGVSQKLQPALLPAGLVEQTRILDGHAHRACDGNEQLEVLGAEPGLNVGSVDLKDTDRNPLVVPERNTHQRADPRDLGAAAGAESAVGSDVEGEYGLPFTQHVVEDRAG